MFFRHLSEEFQSLTANQSRRADFRQLWCSRRLWWVELGKLALLRKTAPGAGRQIGFASQKTRGADTPTANTQQPTAAFSNWLCFAKSRAAADLPTSNIQDPTSAIGQQPTATL